MRKQMMLTLTALAAVAWLAAAHAAEPAAREKPPAVTGPAVVIDGDTLHLGPVTIRLSGIDAPEIGQPGGAFAAGRLDAITTGRPIRCQPVGHDRYKRTVATCRAGETDLAEAMVTAGAARVAEKYLRPANAAAYRAAEAGARAAGAGLWHDRRWRPAQSRVDFDPPPTP